MRSFSRLMDNHYTYRPFLPVHLASGRCIARHDYYLTSIFLSSRAHIAQDLHMRR